MKDKEEAITKEQIMLIPKEVREAVLTWISQGRDEEHIYAVVNFFTGVGADLIAQERRKAKIEVLDTLIERLIDKDIMRHIDSGADMTTYVTSEAVHELILALKEAELKEDKE